MQLGHALRDASGKIARRDAETLLLHVCAQDRAWLLAHPEAELSPAQQTAFFALAGRRSRHEPLQYLTGHQEFFGLDLHVASGALIPRPETELLVEAVLSWTAANSFRTAPQRLVDVGTGSGAIALALATHLPEAEITALDLSPAALEVASANAERLGHRIRFGVSDLLADLPQGSGSRDFDAIVSNPPYVPLSEAATLQPEVRDYEPHTALFGGVDGLALYRRLIPEAFRLLRPAGLLALEIGFGQRDGLAALLEGWLNVHFLSDLAGIPRVALANRP